jgi:hypothetical protein
MNPTRYRWATFGTALATAAGLLACGMVLGLTWGQTAVASGCSGLPQQTCTTTAATLGERIWLMAAVGLPALLLGLGGRLYLRQEMTA